MAVTKPVIFTPFIDQEVYYPRSVPEETTRKLAQNINMQGEFAKIGSIRCIQLNQPGVQAPDPTIWQLCDGSEIVNPNSPLRSVGLVQRFTPDIRNRFLRGTTSLVANNQGGNLTLNLSHNHGGNTGSTGGPVVGEEGDEKVPRHGHNHPIDPDLSSIEPLNPAAQYLAFYLKVT